MTSEMCLPMLRIAVSLAAIAVTVALHRALFRDADAPTRRRGALVLGVPLIIAVLVSHASVLDEVVPRIFPAGVVVGLAIAVWSLVNPTARASFDRLRDGDIRMLVGSRAAFGAILLGFGVAGALPASFALSGGVGDIVVACAAIAAPGSLDRSGSRSVRALVHGAGLVDMLAVMVEAGLVVRPFAIEHPGVMTSMTLPWLLVPLMVAIDLHGLRKVFAAPEEEPLRDGPESPRRVRSALS